MRSFRRLCWCWSFGWFFASGKLLTIDVFASAIRYPACTSPGRLLVLSMDNLSSPPYCRLQTSDVIGLDPYWIGWIWMDFGWIGLVVLHYWMDWIDARKSNWIQLPKGDSRYLVKVHHGSGGLAPRTRVCFALAGVLAIRNTRASCFPSHIC